MSRSEWASSSSFQPVNADSLVNNQLFRRESWDRYVDWHRHCLHEDGLLESQIPDFKWFLWAQWQVDCGGQVEVEVDCGGQHNWCIRPAQTRRFGPVCCRIVPLTSG
jgi:hypothetical protein